VHYSYAVTEALGVIDIIVRLLGFLVVSEVSDKNGLRFFSL